jgi:hypothetical protein
MFRAYNITGTNDPQWGPLAMRFSADYLELWNSQTGSHHIESAPAQDLQVAINGSAPAPGYKDQAGGFAGNETVNFFWIWGAGPGLAMISSLRKPYQGPIQPSGYDHFCHAGSVVIQIENGCLPSIVVRGQDHYFTTCVLAHDPTLVNDPGNEVEHFISVAPFVPDIAQDFTVLVDSQLVSNNGAGASSLNRVKPLPGAQYIIHENLTTPAGAGYPGASEVAAGYKIPNISRGIYFDWHDFVFFQPNSVLHRWMTLYVLGYTVAA